MRSTPTPAISTPTGTGTICNGDRVFQEGEETTLIQRVGGTAGAAIDPNLENPYTDEASVFVERAVMTDLGVRAGFVWKKDSDGWQRDNANRPLSAFNVPVVDRRSGSGRHRRHRRTTAPTSRRST